MVLSTAFWKVESWIPVLAYLILLLYNLHCNNTRLQTQHDGVRTTYYEKKVHSKFFQNPFLGCPWTIYSATTILEKCRKVVLEKWFCKLGFFFWSTTSLKPEKKLDLWYKTTFFLVNHYSRTRFLEPDFLNQISRNRFLRTAKIEGAE